jgi:hypothetical protein
MYSPGLSGHYICTPNMMAVSRHSELSSLASITREEVAKHILLVIICLFFFMEACMNYFCGIAYENSESTIYIINLADTYNSAALKRNKVHLL